MSHPVLIKTQLEHFCSVILSIQTVTVALRLSFAVPLTMWILTMLTVILENLKMTGILSTAAL